MSHKHFILAHDLGTTGNKATLFDADGAIVAAAFAGYSTAYPQPNWAEQNPADWQQAVFTATRRLLAASGISANQIAAVSFSGQMNAALGVDINGAPVRSCIIWADQRAMPQANFIRETCGEAEIYRLTGNRVSAVYSAAKLLWIKDHQPELYRRIYNILLPKDYAVFLLTGVFATDYSDASLTQLFDLNQRCWATDVAEKLGISPDLLPPVYPSAAVVGEVTLEAAQATGLTPGTPVVIGGGDGACATVGSGAVRAGDVYNYIGSSSWIGLAASRPLLDPQRRTFSIAHLDPALYVAIGTTQAAGGAYDWLERLLRASGQTEPDYDSLNDAAGQVAPGATGLLFLPYLLGERSPHWDPLARAAFVGLAMPNSRAELARVVLEGVTFNLRHILDILRSQGASVAAMRLIGGGSKSALWRQIMADIYNLPILRLNLPAAATSLGAAIAGGVGVGLYSDYSVARRLIPVIEAEKPNPAVRARYERLYEVLKDTNTALEPIYHKLAALPE